MIWVWTEQKLTGCTDGKSVCLTEKDELSRGWKCMEHLRHKHTQGEMGELRLRLQR